MSIRTKSILCFLLIMLGISSPLFLQAQSDPSREVIVMFRPGIISIPDPYARATLSEVQINNPAIETALYLHNVQQLWRAIPSFNPADTLRTSKRGELVVLPDFSNVMVLTVQDQATVLELINELNSMPYVIFAEQNGLLPSAECPPSGYPNDLYYPGNQWNLNNCGIGLFGADINAPEAWEITTGSSNVVISIVDHGIVKCHEDLIDRGITGDSGIDGDKPLHGTKVAGILCAVPNNSIGIAGIDWMAEINCIQTTNELESRSDGIARAVNYGADIINMSFGATDYFRLIHLQIASAHKLDILCVGAAGEDEPDYSSSYPSDLYEVISVAGTNRWDLQGPSHLSNFLDVSAPGEEVWTTIPIVGNEYGPVSGTSFAAPHVSGVAGLLLSVDPSLSNDDIRGIIMDSADNIGPIEVFGAGRLNALEALNRLSPPYTIKDHRRVGGYHYLTYPDELQGFFDAPGIADGVYRARPYEVRKYVTFPNPYVRPPSVWGQKTSFGYSRQATHLNEGFCRPIRGTITKTGCTLRTYVYELWTVAGEHVGFVPSGPGNQTFDYTVLGIEDLNPPSPQVLYPNGGEVFYSLDEIDITWKVTDEYPEGTSSDVFLIEELPDGTLNVDILAENQTVDSEGNGSYTWRVPAGSGTVDTYKIRITTTDTNAHSGCFPSARVGQNQSLN